MNKGSKEFYEIRDQFERDFPSMPIRGSLEHEPRESSYFYSDGNIDNVFRAYMAGYSYAASKIETGG